MTVPFTRMVKHPPIILDLYRGVFSIVQSIYELSLFGRLVLSPFHAFCDYVVGGLPFRLSIFIRSCLLPCCNM